MNALSPVEKIEDWFASRCNGAWEHQFGLTIESTDNPGWQVSLDMQSDHFNLGACESRLIEMGAKIAKDNGGIRVFTRTLAECLNTIAILIDTVPNVEQPTLPHSPAFPRRPPAPHGPPLPTSFKLGDRIQVLDQCFSVALRGAVGIICAPPAEVIVNDPSWNSYWKVSDARDSEGISLAYWVKFDPIISGNDPTHLIEAAEIEETDLMHYSG